MRSRVIIGYRPKMNLAAFIEHTALAASVTPADAERLCAEAIERRFYGVCLAPNYVARARQCLSGSSVRLVTVVGFPLGANTSTIKAREASEAVADGAEEIDMVGAIGMACCGAWSEVEDDIAQVRRSVPGATLKVILETGYFAEEALSRFAEVALAAGADWLKTSTGLGPRGATIADVVLLRKLSAGRAAIKASGGIRTVQDAEALLAAGATRLGTSHGIALVS